MGVLPDIDALALSIAIMFEKANPLVPSNRALAGNHRLSERGRVIRLAPGHCGDQADSRSSRRAGDALRVVEWSEITARLKAARDLRLLMRSEASAPIEGTAASFGDAAASYFALLDHNERGVNLDALEQSKVLGEMTVFNDTNHSEGAAEEAPVAANGDAKEMQ